MGHCLVNAEEGDNMTFGNALGRNLRRVKSGCLSVYELVTTCAFFLPVLSGGLCVSSVSSFELQVWGTLLVFL